MANFKEYGAPTNFLNDAQASSRTVEEVQDQYGDQLDEIEEELSEEEALFEEMSEVEVRLEEANCYKALLNGQLFSQRTPISKRVEGRIREYIKQQLRILVGLDTPKDVISSVTYKSPFTPEEENRLKSLAQKMIERENANNSGPPTLNKPVEVPKTQAAVQTINPVSIETKVSVESKPVSKTIKKSKPSQANELVKQVKPPKKTEKVTITLPNGKVVETNVYAQTTNTSAIPKMSAQQIADVQAHQAERQVLHSQPKDGIIGPILAQITSGLIIKD